MLMSLKILTQETSEGFLCWAIICKYLLEFFELTISISLELLFKF